MHRQKGCILSTSHCDEVETGLPGASGRPSASTQRLHLGTRGQDAGPAARELLLLEAKGAFAQRCVLLTNGYPQNQGGVWRVESEKDTKAQWFLGSSPVWRARLLSAVTFPRKAERNHSFVICSDLLVKCAHTHTHILQMGVSVLERSILQHDACNGQASPEPESSVPGCSPFPTCHTECLKTFLVCATPPEHFGTYNLVSWKEPRIELQTELGLIQVFSLPGEGTPF